MEDPGSDLSQLDTLTEESILEVIKTRYQKDKIYSNVGEDILIAVNPFKELPIYDKENHEKYGWNDFRTDLPSHIFHVAARAYRRMRQKHSNQIILVCGESGAGKTESAKYMVQHFMQMCPEDSGDLHERIIRVNPLLESFGNAKTVMNDNSSRFAKFLELSFKNDGQVTGAAIRDYMLEKCRVVGRNKECGERNFHIFYEMFAGLSQQEKQELFLLKPESYSILKGGIKSPKVTKNYENQYKENMETLKRIGITEADKKVMHCMLAAILHLSQIEFRETDQSSGQLEIVDTELVEQAASLLEVNSEMMGHALISSTPMMAGVEIKVYKSVDQANDGRDALAKHMYERLFGWIVMKINTNLHPNKSSSNTEALEIGILDIAGFENLQTNSLEQMCINMVNERLQYFMNNVVLIQEKKIYESEEIPFENVDFKDNMDIIQMFEISKIGIWPSLDEESKFQQGTDSNFVERLKKNFPNGHSFNYLLTFARGDLIGFGVKHFAGDVWYSCENFLEKNRDTLNKDIEDVMKSSNDGCIADLFSVRKGDTGTISNTQYNIRASRKVPGLGRSIRTKTDQGGLQGVDLGRTLKEKYGKVGKPTELIYMPRDSKTNVSYFQKSISQLLSKLRHADSFFVRCIKPNQQMDPEKVDEKLVRGQLKYNGISEICLIRKNGYPSRILIEDFIKRYKPLFSFSVSNNEEMVPTILNGTLPIDLRDKYRVGKNKVFMKESVNSHIERVRFSRRKWAASVIADRLKKNCEVQKRKRLKKEQEEKESKRILEQVGKRKKEEKENNRNTEEQLGKDRKITEGAAGFGSLSNGIGNSYKGTIHDNDSDDTDKTEGDDEFLDTHRFKDLKGTKKVKERKKKSSSTDSSSGSGSYDPSLLPHRRGLVKKEQSGPPPKNKQKFWDIFQTIPRETKTQDVHTHTSLRIIKVLTYIALFLMLLACLVIQKISLATLISGFRPDRKGDYDTAETDEERAKESSASYILTLIAVCTPYLIIFIVNIWRSLFGNIPTPSIFNILTCVVIEIFHSIGLCLLVFHLLPDLGAVQGIGLLSAVAIVPSLLKPLFSNDAENDKSRVRVPKKILCFVLDLLAFFVQLSAIPILIIPYTQYIHGNDTHTVNDVRHLNSTSPGFEMSTHFERVKIVGALLLCSLCWWENFIDKFPWSEKSRIKQAFFKLKFDLQESRPFFSLVVAIFKVGTSVLFAYLLMKDPLSFDFKETFKVVGNNENANLYSGILALVFSGCIGYYLAKTVCKLQMQRFSFSIPCLLSTPIAMIALIFECNIGLEFVSTVSKHSLSTSCDNKILVPWHHIPLAAVWLLSFYWVARHIWFPKQERLAKVERLFVNPFYCGILLEQHLVLNRKRHNRRIVIDPQNNGFNYDQKSGSTAETDEKDKKIPPMIYACATMWHEKREEIVQLLKSLFRMDKDQFMRKKAYEISGSKNMQEVEYYEFEAHILFDDAFELNDNKEMVPNSFVKLYSSLLNEAASAVHSKRIDLPPPFIIPSRYGGQVIFTMPGGNFIYTHLKDKKKIRCKKRWSQVMYMYYLLGYRIVKESKTFLMEDMKSTDKTRQKTWDERLKKATGRTGKSVIFESLNEEVLFRAENTFLLALDGDVDFTPGAVRLLLDRMRKNPKVGAACGRIHPIGSGPMVWYQKFEYAVAHWLQKSTEHVLGCVLCSPGCFSLFRGSALMDDNVMHKYTTKPTEPSHHLMYDQGEDRWLCTLLLQQGYRVDYAAASDAFTYAPEGFDEYFNQRRRWTPSTIANILDLLQDGRNTVASNNNISWLYIVYQAALMVSTIIGPATVLMMIAGALLTVFSIDLITSYIISLIPAILFFIICFVFDTKIQLIVAQILSGVYVFLMMVVFVGAIITAVTVTPYHPSVIFLSGLVLIFLIAAAFHPREFHNLIFGILYFLWVPSGFLVLIIYSLCNLHVVSWGTREVPKKKTKDELAQEEADKKAKEEQKKKDSFWNKFFPFFNLVQDLKHTITEKMTSEKGKEHEKLTEVLIKMNENLEKINKKRDSDVELEDVVVDENKSKKEKKTVRFSNKNEEKELDEFDEETYVKQKAEKNKMNDLVNPAWVKEEIFSGGELMQMIPEERDFWEGFVNTYLKPLEKDKEKEKKDTEKLMELRNNVCGGMALINMLWVAINFMFQYKKPTVIDIPLSYGKEEEDLDKQQAENVLKVDVVGLMFIIFFLFILLIQFFGMIVHRWGTFMHLIAITEIPSPFGKTEADVKMSYDSLKKRKGKIAVEFCEKMMAEPVPDYPSDDESIEENRKELERDLAREQIKNIAETGTKDRAGQLNIGASLRNTMMGRESTRESYSNQLRRSTHKISFDNEDFLKRSEKYLEEAKLPKEDETTGIRYRKRGKGKKLLENENSGVRKIGSTAPAQRDFIERIRKNSVLAEKFKLNTSQRNLEERSLGQSFSSGENVNMEEDDIYDEIPATGTLGRMWAKKLRIFNQSFSSTQQNRRNSELNQFLS